MRSGKLEYGVSTLPPDCLQKPYGDPIELFISLDPLSPWISHLVLRVCLTALFLFLNPEAKNPDFNVDKQTNQTQIDTITSIGSGSLYDILHS